MLSYSSFLSKSLLDLRQIQNQLTLDMAKIYFLLEVSFVRKHLKKFQAFNKPDLTKI